VVSGSRDRLWVVAVLTALFLLWPCIAAAAYTTPEPGGETPPLSADQARARLTQGFRQVLTFFAERDFSLLEAWSEMRESGDPDYFERQYPSISEELDRWASTLERRFGVSSRSEETLDFTFVLDEFAPVVFDPDAAAVMRDNALATVCMVCVMDSLRCAPGPFHRFLATVVNEDPSPRRKAEALRWWRRSDGVIDEGLLDEVLASPAGADPELRAEAARILFSIATRRSLAAQRRLATTAGLPADADGSMSRVACTAIRHFASAGYVEATPQLLAALEDPSRAVRGCAAETLATLSGRSYGFDPAADGPGNAEAIARWRAWWTGRSSLSSGATR